ncbi:hypothetical protein B0H13DRAFT_2463274 [Mycena leptocephala]|nr:hypothetical protein B0H13DRAFT_2463274 [Mycena leptocephala]
MSRTPFVAQTLRDEGILGMGYRSERRGRSNASPKMLVHASSVVEDVMDGTRRTPILLTLSAQALSISRERLVRLPCARCPPAAASSRLIRSGRMAGDCRSVGDDEETQLELRMCTPVRDRRSRVGGYVCGEDGGDKQEGERGGAGDADSGSARGGEERVADRERWQNMLAVPVVLRVALRKAAAQCRACAGGLLQRKVGLRRWVTERSPQERQRRMLRVRLVVWRLSVERVSVAQRRERYSAFGAASQSRSWYGGSRRIARGVVPVPLVVATHGVGYRVHAVVLKEHRVWARKDEWKKGSHLDNGKPLPDAVVDDYVANVRSIRRQTGLETVNETVEVVLQCDGQHSGNDRDTTEEGQQTRKDVAGAERG